MPPKKRNAASRQAKKSKPAAGSSSQEKSSGTFDKPCEEGKDTEFLILCNNLNVSQVICDHAWDLWNQVRKSVAGVETVRRQWTACLFVVKTDLDDPCFTLSQVLNVVGLKVKQFLDLLRKMDENYDFICPRVNLKMERLEKKYDVLMTLYCRFEKCCKKIFTVTPDGKENVYIRNCWTMFLLAKGKTFQMEDDLVISFQLLLCTLELFIKNCPPQLVQDDYKLSSGKSFDTHKRTSRRNLSNANPEQDDDTGPENEHKLLLEKLCKENECNIEEVTSVYHNSFSVFLKTLNLPQKPDFSLMADVNKQYQQHFNDNNEFDGRLFLDENEILLAPKVDLSKEIKTEQKPQPGEEGGSLPPRTPIRHAMTSIRLLQVDLPPSSDYPSKVLKKYFKNCTLDPTADIFKRLEKCEVRFSEMFGAAIGSQGTSYGSQRFKLGVRLYFKVMESMLISEEKRLCVQNFSKLLNDETFHTSLLACSLEVVLATYEESSFKRGTHHHGDSPNDSDVCFPWILSVMQISAFGFYKVIESFIKAEPTLNKDIIRHMMTCENLILEKLAWKSGSMLFELMRLERENEAAWQEVGHAADRAVDEAAGQEGSHAADQATGRAVSQAADQETAATVNQPLQHTSTTDDLYLSQAHPVSYYLRSEAAVAQASVHTSSKFQKFTRSNSLCLFYKKLYRLAYMRLKTLCANVLAGRPELEPIIWTLFQHTLRHKYELMQDRHLDQLMLSAMYAICKVKGIDLRFKSIVMAYRELPNTNQNTFKNVLIRNNEYDSIIVFYNQIFMQKLKSNILQYASPNPPPLSPIPEIPRTNYKIPKKPQLVPGSSNVYVSPLKHPGGYQGIHSPRSKMLVSIGESFANPNRFKKINQMVSASSEALKRRRDLLTSTNSLKRLRFDVEGQDEADGSKSGESTLIAKLTEMSSTRTRMQEQRRTTN